MAGFPPEWTLVIFTSVLILFWDVWSALGARLSRRVSAGFHVAGLGSVKS
ncbi:MAG TPA: hypothetical protein VLL82_00910 [Mycobacterium sp.]|nr:hypothetical protein [Mycobacterium sp.]